MRILELGKWRHGKLHDYFIASFELPRGTELKSQPTRAATTAQCCCGKACYMLSLCSYYNHRCFHICDIKIHLRCDYYPILSTMTSPGPEWLPSNWFASSDVCPVLHKAAKVVLQESQLLTSPCSKSESFPSCKIKHNSFPQPMETHINQQLPASLNPYPQTCLLPSSGANHTVFLTSARHSSPTSWL